MTRSAVRPAKSFRAESGLSGDLPYLEASRSGAMATYPWAASLSTTVVSHAVSPKIWCMTRMVGARSFRSGHAT